MWLMTVDGFYSAVAHRELPDMLLVRARAKADLRRLDRYVPGVSRRIFRDADADYLWRVVVSREEWALTLARMGTEVEYDNFKSAVARRSRPRERIYHRVWAELTRIERGFDRRYYGWPPRVTGAVDLPRTVSAEELDAMWERERLAAEWDAEVGS